MGLEARRLGVQLKIFTMNFQEFKNLSKAVESSDLEITGYVPKCLTISEAVLSDDEKKQGVMVVDLSSENPKTRTSLGMFRMKGQTAMLFIHDGTHEGYIIGRKIKNSIEIPGELKVGEEPIPG